LFGQAAKQERGLANAIETQRVISPVGRTDIRDLCPELTGALSSDLTSKPMGGSVVEMPR
jgi:hypothetical protein